MKVHNASVSVLKSSSTPSFIKRGNEIIQIEANNLPIGIIEHVEMDTVSKKLKPEDIIIMMSDGVFDGPKHIKNNDVWLKHKIQNLKTRSEERRVGKE